MTFPRHDSMCYNTRTHMKKILQTNPTKEISVFSYVSLLCSMFIFFWGHLCLSSLWCCLETLADQVVFCLSFGSEFKFRCGKLFFHPVAYWSRSNQLARSTSFSLLLYAMFRSLCTTKN